MRSGGGAERFRPRRLAPLSAMGGQASEEPKYWYGRVDGWMGVRMDGQFLMVVHMI